MPANVFYFEWETAFQAWIQTVMGPLLTSVASFFTMFGEEIILTAIIGYIYWCYDKKFGKYIGINVAVGLVLNPLIKNIALRKRPYMVHEDIKCLRPVEKEADIMDIAAQGYSFPSGHSSNAALIYGSLPVYDRKHKWLRAVAVLLSLLVGLSRVMLGVHYVTDVLAGWILGIAIVIVVPWLHRVIKNEKIFYGLMVLLALPGWFYCRSNDYYTGFGMMLGFFLGFQFEEKHVRFENAQKPLESVIRLLGGLLLFLGLNTALKLPFSAEFLESGTALAFAVRAARYGLVCFIDIGVYPMLFRHIAKIGKTAAE